MSITDIDDLSKSIFNLAVVKGWYHNDEGKFELRNTGEMLALIHSEVSEALECYRNNPNLWHIWERESDGKPEGFFIELADVIIRCLDMFAAYSVSPSEVILKKHAFNRTRPYKHGGKTC